MKINKSDDLQNELIKSLASKTKDANSSNSKASAVPAAGEQKVQIGLSQFINQELNPADLLAERKQRVEKLKELISSGKYNVSSEAIAKSLSEELSFEILTSPKDSGDDEELI